MTNKLADWLNADPKPMTKTAFAAAIGVTPGYVSQLCGAEPPWPSREVAKRIAEVTSGAVTPNDWFVEAAQ
jgi:3,4-dihydroxy 2-butanone 4-phosphate synthase / GTP cyclohydrolase II